MAETEVLIPPLLKEMAGALVKDLEGARPQHHSYLVYISGWIEAAAKDEYRQLIQRDGPPWDPRIAKLLCELAITRALVRWHEIRDRPPPMPSINKIK